jgi:hypothetical protein
VFVFLFRSSFSSPSWLILFLLAMIFDNSFLVVMMVKFNVIVPGHLRQFADLLSSPIEFKDVVSGRIGCT